MGSSRSVYSTDHGRMCPHCGQPVAGCRCGRKRGAPAGDGIVRVSRSVKGRKGKSVTVIEGVPLAGQELKALAKVLKAACGAGGAIKDSTIEIQGEHRDALIPLLEARGWTVRRSGG